MIEIHALRRKRVPAVLARFRFELGDDGAPLVRNTPLPSSLCLRHGQSFASCTTKSLIALRLLNFALWTLPPDAHVSVEAKTRVILLDGFAFFARSLRGQKRNGTR